ncbi:YraN family protein [Octadecabacter antarcticus]|uniref:YraN family protein n=1 Tax=Octadecabacter antarcticus TaxID=1217908 RepID=UPI00018070BD|nr:YraN family protein [Octadecabacter antarcticus]
MNAKQRRGQTAYHAGMAAEDIVAERYARCGRPILAERWRGTAGEIDLIAREGDTVIFVEVKKSLSHAQAVTRLTRRQMDRIYGAGSEFLATQPRGQLTEVRFDLALVDDMGRIKVIENAFMAA